MVEHVPTSAGRGTPPDPQTSKGGDDMAENTTGLEPGESTSTESDTGPDVQQEGDFQGEY